MIGYRFLKSVETSRFGSCLSALILLASLGYASSSHAQSTTTFFCAVGGDGIPTTFAQTSRGHVPVIKWSSEYFSDDGYSPDRRCREVTSQFNNLYRQGRLNYLSAGRKNGLPIICALGTPSGECTQLYTLKRGQDASRVLANLRAVQMGARGPLYESTRRISSDVIDLNAYLESAPVEQVGSTSQPNVAPANPSPSIQPTQPAGGGTVW